MLCIILRILIRYTSRYTSLIVEILLRGLQGRSRIFLCGRLRDLSDIHLLLTCVLRLRYSRRFTQVE